ncbi:SRPBCC family protein [Novosphingobium kaempferiae]|uniref:SRPBCC family protein n=1 Tax=Novosphingobium kaempferiae TaxID=2896849 RepID=UPI001E42B2AA|nr:SRPBCC family protein [Novosphingobium kaempferiae]
MASLEARLIGITIDRPMDEAYAFASRPENFPEWAAGMSSSLHRDGERWLAETPLGEATIRFSPANDFGVLDHWVMLPGKPVVYIPLRLIENGTGTQVVFTLFRQPGMTDADFDRDAAMVGKDLTALKRLLENREPLESRQS